MIAWGEFSGDSAVASRRQGPPSEIDASLGSSLIYAFITVNNASPFTSGLSCRSFSHVCLPIYSTPVYLVSSFISQSYTCESHSIAGKAVRSSKSNAVFRCILKRLGARIYPSPAVSMPPSCRTLRLDPHCCPSYSSKY